MSAQSGLGFSGIVAVQIPDDGATGTVLTKQSAEDYDYDWDPVTGFAPANAEFLTLSLDPTLTNERVLVGGDGLTLTDGGPNGNATLDVVANADGSIIANADDIQVGVINDTQHGNLSGGSLHALAVAGVSAGFISGADQQKLDNLITNAVPDTRVLTAGAGLVGGGDLSADRTFDVVANADGSIVVNADDVQVGVLATDAQHGNRGNGTLHSVFTAVLDGFAPASGGGTANFLRADGNWAVPPGGGGGAPTDAEYVVLSLNGTLTDERVLVGGAGLTLTDGGAGGNATLDVVANADGSIVVNANDIQVGVISDAQHGNRSGGSLHALAVAGVSAGFISGADQQKLDNLITNAVPDTRVLTAGAGLTGGGDLSADRTFDVVANADGSIVVNANDVQVGVLATDAQHGNRGGGSLHALAVAGVSAGFISGADQQKLDNLITNAVPDTRTLTAGAGLTGGGDLTADRTFDVGAGTGITVNANDVQLDLASNRNVDHSLVVLTAGLGLSGGGDITASRTFDVNVQNSITINVDTLELVNDVLAPGANQVYGTDGAGTKGWQPAGGGGGAPTNAEYVVLALDATLTDERVLVAGDGLTLTDGGANSNVTIDVVANADGSIVANANDIQVGVLATDAQHGTRGGGPTLHSDATTVLSGFIEIATQAEVDAGVDTTRAVTPDTLNNTTLFDARYVTVGAPAQTITSVKTFNPFGTGIIGQDDIDIGGVTYGLMSIGAAEFGRTNFNAGALDLDGSVLSFNSALPATSNIEFAWVDGIPNIRFALAVPGPGNATYNPRSMIIAGPAVLDDNVVTVGFWQGLGFFDNLAMDTATNGADLGVQNDLEVEGIIYTDIISESTPAAAITFEADPGTVKGQMTWDGNQIALFPSDITFGEGYLIGWGPTGDPTTPFANRINLNSASGFNFLMSNADFPQFIIGSTTSTSSVFIDGNGNKDIRFNTLDTGFDQDNVVYFGYGGINLQDNAGDAIFLRSPFTVAGTFTITLPPTAGSIGQVLVNQDGAGTLDWGDQVPTTRNLTAGAGLTGGGDLTADRTFDVGANADGSITVNADDIQVGVLATDAQHGNRGGGALHSVFTAGLAGFAPASGGGTQNFLRADGTFADPNIALPASYTESGSTNITTVVATVGYDTEELDPDGNYAIAAGELTTTAGGYFNVSYSIPTTVDSGGGAPRGKITAFVERDQGIATFITIPQSFAAVYTREATPGSGLSASFIVLLAAGEVIRVRISINSTTDVSTTAGESSLSLHRVRLT